MGETPRNKEEGDPWAQEAKQPTGVFPEEPSEEARELEQKRKKENKLGGGKDVDKERKLRGNL